MIAFAASLRFEVVLLAVAKGGLAASAGLDFEAERGVALVAPGIGGGFLEATEAVAEAVLAVEAVVDTDVTFGGGCFSEDIEVGGLFFTADGVAEVTEVTEAILVLSSAEAIVVCLAQRNCFYFFSLLLLEKLCKYLPCKQTNSSSQLRFQLLLPGCFLKWVSLSVEVTNLSS